MAVCALAVLATLGLAGTCAAHYGGKLGAPPGGSLKNAPVAQASRPLRLAQSGQGSFFSFLESLFGVRPRGEPRRQRWREPLRQPAVREAPPQVTEPHESAPAGIATYRTVCVRLCDGYYWPVSFATSKDNVGRDEQVCLQGCSAPAALYYYPNPGGELDDMVSLQGQPYKSLATAFVYRTTYDASCKCRPHPWEAAAIERHKAYAASQAPPRAVAQGARPRR